MYHYAHGDGRTGTGINTWAAIVNAIGKGEASNIELSRFDIQWSYSEHDINHAGIDYVVRKWGNVHNAFDVPIGCMRYIDPR